MTQPIHSFTVTQNDLTHTATHRLLADAQASGFTSITHIECSACYYLQGTLTEAEKTALADKLFCDPVAQTGTWQATVSATATTHTIETALRPGVTDPVAEQISIGARRLGINTVDHTATGQRFLVHSQRPLSADELHSLAQRVLTNPVIQLYALGQLQQVFAAVLPSTQVTAIIALRQLTPAELVTLAQERRSALALEEMLAIQAYYNSEERDPTDVEFETIAQTWSEHCSHKTFKATINIEQQESVKGLLKTYIKSATDTINAPWVWSAFDDNAGIIDFDDDYQVSFKVETHNHPSAIEPFGGANTGLGGVIRDILGVSSKPIAATDIFCFGPQALSFAELPPGTLHPQHIAAGVIAGVQDYGNKTGIPTVNGTIWYDAGYIANPLVYCGCVGLVPKKQHPRRPQAGDRVIVLGGRTGRDGLRGATFSSMSMDAQTGAVAGASVQIGDPIIAKGLIEVITRALEAKLYHAITDCGAGGLSSAVGEMASTTGAEIELAQLPLKYSGLKPWEIWLSEAQERMVLAVPPHHVATLEKICTTFNIGLTDIGQFTATQRLIVHYEQTVVLSLSNAFLHHAMPIPQLTAVVTQPITTFPAVSTHVTDLTTLLLTLLAEPNIASKEKVIRLYDHEVQGGTVVKPLTGVLNDGPADACVIKPRGTQGTHGIVLANGLNPEIGKYDPYNMAISVIDEAIRNAIAVGADPDRLAILDNFCWGNPQRPETLGALVAACRGCYDAALHYRTPFISGKDSLNNEYYSQDQRRHAIPGTLLISALGFIADVNKAVTSDFKTAGNYIYLLGKTPAEFAGSHFVKCGGEPPLTTAMAPSLPAQAPLMYRQLHSAMQNNWVRACHDLSEGGLAVALAEMCIGGRLGCSVQLTAEIITALFSEANGRLIVEVAPAHSAAFAANFAPELCYKLGEVTAEPQLLVSQSGAAVIAVTVAALVQAWQGLS